MSRLLLLAGPLLVYAQLALLDHEMYWGRTRFTLAGEVLVAVAAVTILSTVCLRNRVDWGSAALAAVSASLLVVAAWIGIRHGPGLGLGQAVMFFSGGLAGLTVLAWGLVQPAPRPALVAAGTWLSVPPVLLLIA